MFFGIIIRMFYSEHNPPHFHAEYQGAEGIFNFEGEMIQGNSHDSKTPIDDAIRLHHGVLHVTRKK
jgi:hypothetical protein